VRRPVNCCYLRSAWKAELYLTFMSRLREQDFIEISITYMNNNEFKHIGKLHAKIVSDIRPQYIGYPYI
jgi:hypothetical protein